MTQKRTGLLILLSLLSGLVVFQTPASAGTWELTYSSGGSANVHYVRETEGNDPDESNSLEPFELWRWLYSNDPDSQCKRLLPAPVAALWIDPHIDAEEVWGDTNDIWGTFGGSSWPHWLSSAYVADSGSVNVNLSWVPGYDGEVPPEKVWVKYATGMMWCMHGSSFTVFSHMDNSCEDIYGSFHIPYADSKTVGAYSYGLGYAELDGSSGYASVTVPLDMDVSGSGVIGGFHNQAYVHAQALYDAPPLPERKLTTPWRTGVPHCFFTTVVPVFHPCVGGTLSGGDPVDLATGAHLDMPDPDIVAYNPYGPNAQYQRNYLGLSAEDGHSSLGLSTGWVDNYDVKIVGSFSEDGDRVSLVYPNGSEDVFHDPGGISVGRPSSVRVGTLEEDDPPIELQPPTSAPYIITSVPSETPKRWESITLTFKDKTQWVFTSEDGVTYRLSRIADQMGRYISIVRDSGGRVSVITDDMTPANELLSFHYVGSNLSYVSDAHGRKVIYTFGQAAETTCLLSVSQICAATASGSTARESYGYTLLGGQPHLTSTSSPSPTGTNLRTETINYDSETLKVTSLVDAEANQCVFSYNGYNGRTKVQVKNPDGEVQKEWTERFDPSNGNIRTGTIDADHHGTTLLYGDYQNRALPTTVADREGKTSTITYDQYGNTTSVTSPGGVQTVYTYDYPNDELPSEFPFGRLVSVQVGTLTPTTFTYYEPSGLVHTITGPKPGTTDGSTVTSTFTYDALGNILTKTIPASSDSGTMITIYNYTTDGDYTQPAKIGQPLTVTDNLGHVTHFRYDARGNVISTKDALGHETNFTYNIADQVVSTTYPEAVP